VSARPSPRSPSERRIRRSLDRILKQNVLCAVATIGPRGRAHIHICYFATSPELELFFISDSRSRHATNLRRRPSAAIAVFSSGQSWGGGDRGAQLFGRCGPVPPRERERARQIYGGRFPELATNPTVRGLAFYRFVTRRVTVLDEREFGDAVLVKLSIRHRPLRRQGQLTRR
jgi:uncharacterized protein YhbP (UPF0306 family)